MFDDILGEEHIEQVVVNLNKMSEIDKLSRFLRDEFPEEVKNILKESNIFISDVDIAIKILTEYKNL